MSSPSAPQFTCRDGTAQSSRIPTPPLHGKSAPASAWGAAVLPAGDVVVLTITIPAVDIPRNRDPRKIGEDLAPVLLETARKFVLPEKRVVSRRQRITGRACEENRRRWISIGADIEAAVQVRQAEGNDGADALAMVAAEMGLSAQVAGTYLRLHRREARQKRDQKVWKLYREGLSGSAIGERVGLSKMQVSRIVRSFKAKNGRGPNA